MSALGNHICNFITYDNLSAPFFYFKVKVRGKKMSVVFFVNAELHFINCSHEYSLTVLQIIIITNLKYHSYSHAYLHSPPLS